MSNPSALAHLSPVEEIEGALDIKRRTFEDDRGFFAEVLKRDYGLPAFVQQNTSFSFGGVLRGMHTQRVNPQGKLLTCLYGTVLDVIFDVRPASKTFGKGFSKVLDFKEMNSLYAPPGVLHGFVVLSRYAVLHYSCTTEYDPGSDGGANWESPEIREYFPEDISPILSAKDRALPSLEDFLKA